MLLAASPMPGTVLDGGLKQPSKLLAEAGVQPGAQISRNKPLATFGSPNVRSLPLVNLKLRVLSLEYLTSLERLTEGPSSWKP